MKNSNPSISVPLPCERKSVFSRFGSSTALAAMLAILIGLLPNAGAQTENFDSGAAVFAPGPNQWLKAQIHPAIPMVYTHPATDWGLGLQLQAHTASGALPAAVGFAYRTNIYNNWYVAVDIANWPGTDLDQALLLIAHGQNVNPPQDSSSYIINYDTSQYGQTPTSRRQGQFHLSIVFPGFATIQLGIAEYTAVAGERYRLVLKGVDDTVGSYDITAAMYDHKDLTKALVTINGQDGSYVDGVSGIGNFSRAGSIGTTDSTFDNYHAGATDPNLDIAPAIRHAIAGTAQVVTRTPTRRFTTFHPVASGITFTARTFSDDIKVSATKLYLNGVDVSASLSAPAAAPTVSYTTPTSPLVANTTYSARIEVESMAGLKGTNTFWFDTFTDAYVASASVRTIECEDYNYDNGLFLGGSIPVSGIDTNGTQINGAGVGYYGLSGVKGVDYHDNRTSPEGSAGGTFWSDLNAYRPADFVGTYPGDYEILTLLNPNPAENYVGPIVYGNTRLKYASLGMKEYKIVRTEFGEWLNYTRVFANQNYKVLLNVGTFGESVVAMDLVTSDPTLPDQTTSPIGKFYPPNHIMRDNYRFHPLMAGCVPAVVNLSGTSTIRLTMQGTTGQDNRKLYLNYLLLVPTTDPVTSTVNLLASSTVNGSYTSAVGASVNLGTKTITMPISAAAQFFRVCSDVTYTITSINIVGPNVVIVYN